MKRVFSTVLLILATLAGLALLWQLRAAILMFVLSLTVAAAVRPVTDRVVRQGAPPWLANLLVYVVLVIALAGLIFWLGNPILNEVGEGTDNLAAKYEEIVVTWPFGTTFQQNIAERLPPPNDLYEAITGERGAALMNTILGVAEGLFSFLGQAFIILILSVYWSADRAHFERLWLSLVPAEQRAPARETWREVEAGVGAYLRSEIVQLLLAGLLLGLGYRLMGLSYPLLLALLGSVLLLIPWLGAVLGAILPVLFGLTISPWTALAAGVYTIVVFAFMELVIEPRFFDRRRYSSLLIVLTMVVMADVYGLIGLIIAPPLAAAIQILTVRLVTMQTRRPAVPPAEQFERLSRRMEQLQARIAGMQEPPPEVANLTIRTERLLEEVQRSFEREQENDVTELELPAS